MHALWPVVKILNSRHKVSQEILLAVSENVIPEQFVSFNNLFLVKHQKFVYCGKCIVKCENSLGDCI